MKNITSLFSEASLERAEKYPKHCYVEVDTCVGSLRLGNLPLNDSNEAIFDDILENKLQDLLDEAMINWKNKQWGHPTETPNEIAKSISAAYIYC